MKLFIPYPFMPLCLIQRTYVLTFISHMIFRFSIFSMPQRHYSAAPYLYTCLASDPYSDSDTFTSILPVNAIPFSACKGPASATYIQVGKSQTS